MSEPVSLEGSHAQPAGIPIPRRRAKLPDLDSAHDVVDLTSNTPERRYDLFMNPHGRPGPECHLNKVT